MWWFLGGKLSYARMVKIGVHLLQCHTHCSLFCSFNDGGKVLVVEQVQFFWHVHYSAVVDWWTSFIFTNHPSVSHITRALSSMLSTKSDNSNFGFAESLSQSLLDQVSGDPYPICLISGWSTSCWSLAFA